MTLTCTSIFGDNGEFTWFIDNAVTETRTVGGHMTTVDSINVELEWTSCNENKSILVYASIQRSDIH